MWILRRDRALFTAPANHETPDYSYRKVGDKYYELSNHLGNVLEVITDRKLPLEAAATEDLTPTISGSGISVSGGVIMATSGGWGNSGGVSTETVGPEGYMEWTLGGTAPSDNQYIMAGLSYSSPNNHYNTIKNCWYMYTTGADIFESGVNVSGNLGTYAPGDVFKIRRHAGNIEYYWNGVLKRTVSDPQPNDPMIIDFAMYEIGRSIYGLSIHNETTSVAYTADVVSYSDYYPYGMLMPGRHGSEATDKYRYGFQGQEMDDEIKGEGNSLNYTYRMHDPRVGRFFAVDPLAAKYAYNSPYAFSENSVIAFIELEGLEKKYYLQYHYEENGESKLAITYWKTEDGYFDVDSKGNKTDTYVKYEEEFILINYGYTYNESRSFESEFAMRQWVKEQ